MTPVGTIMLRNDSWLIDCEPHAMVRLKRVFAQVRSGSYSAALLKDTPGHARDLLWFMDRYPLEATPADRGHLERQAAVHEGRERSIRRLLRPDYTPPVAPLAVPLRPYQDVAVALAKQARGLLLADEVGLGKTASAIGVLVDPEFLPAVVVTHNHLADQWRRQIERFAPALRVRVPRTGSVDELDKARRGESAGPWDVLVMGYSKLRLLGHALVKRGIRGVVFDEVQELRKGTSEKYRAARALARRADLRLGLSATPIQNYGGEIHSVYECLTPDALGTADEFHAAWCSYGGRNPTLKNPAAFGSFLRAEGLILRRTRADVARELPGLTRIVQEVECDLGEIDRGATAATELARVILGQGARARGEAMRAAAEFAWQLRLATGVAKAGAVAEFTRMVVEGGEPVVLFGWHHEVYDLWAEKLADFKPVFFHGKRSEPQKRAAFAEFVAGRSQVLVCSLQAGAGLDGLQHRAKTVVFGELDWSPAVHEQAVGRLFRDGQEHPVFAYFLTADAGSDPSVISALGVKSDQIQGIRDPDGPAYTPREVDPEHVRNLARDYLRRRGVPVPEPEEARLP